jgi:hypothetical protein
MLKSPEALREMIEALLVLNGPLILCPFSLGDFHAPV